MNKKFILIIGGFITLIVISLFILFFPVLMLLDVFGSDSENISGLEVDGYIANNSSYASRYTEVANYYIKNNKGYVSLERILYFYNEDNSLSFNEIYNDNLDSNLKQMIPITEACKKEKYHAFDVCDEEYIKRSKQINKLQPKPFSKPIDFKDIYVTSYFKEQRIVMNKYGVHDAWDFAGGANTKVYAVCNGTVSYLNFPYKENAQVGFGYGNQITIKCDMDNKNYTVLYGHLYPNSNTVRQGDRVKKGDHIAGVGTTGRSTGNHLHYEVSYKGQVIDGMSYVSFK